MRGHLIPILVLIAALVFALTGCGSEDTAAVARGCEVEAPEPPGQTAEHFEISYSPDTAALRVRFVEAGLGPAQRFLEVWDGVAWKSDYLILFGEDSRYEAVSPDQMVSDGGRVHVAGAEFVVAGDGLDDGWYRIQISTPREGDENAGRKVETVIFSVGCD